LHTSKIYATAILFVCPSVTLHDMCQNRWTDRAGLCRIEISLAYLHCVMMGFGPHKIRYSPYPYCCPRGKPLGPIYKSLSLSLYSDLKSLSLDKVLENCRGHCILQKVRYVGPWSRDVHKFGYSHGARGYGEEWLTYWYQILLIDMYQ